jgi:hypothetical protein
LGFRFGIYQSTFVDASILIPALAKSIKYRL